MKGPSRFAIAKQHAVDALDDLVPELFGGGKLTRRYQDRWAVVNRWRNKANLGQMSVWRQGPRRGAFKDYVNGEKGDVIGLVAYGLQGLVTADTQMAAVEWLEDRFGLRNLSPERQREISDAAQARQKLLEEQAAIDAQTNRDRTRKFFHSCQAQILGTPVETYLNSRGIPLAEVPHLTTAIRFHPNCEFWRGAQRDGEGKKIGVSPRFPAMIAQMITGSGHLGACHYTFLEPDGSRKLDTASRGWFEDEGKPMSAKLMWPSSVGMFIPLTYGPSGLRARDAAEASQADWWGWSEGIEDGLSAAICTQQLRMHAAGSLAHLMGIPNHPAARGHLIFKDNDWNNPQATAQFDAAVQRVRAFGKPVEILAMPADWGKDINEALNRKDF